MRTAPIHVKARYVLLWLIPALLVGIVPLVIVWPDGFFLSEAGNGPLLLALLTLGVEGSWFALTAAHAHAAGMRIRPLFGWKGIAAEAAPPMNVWRLALIALPMIGSAMACQYLLFAPLSLVFPDAVHFWLFQDVPVLYSPEDPFLSSLVAFAGIGLVAPLAEEWIFRGLLLRRWSAKVGSIRAVVRSSLLFCLLHVDLLGSFIFAVTMAGLYARYRSLWAPIIVHMANNTLAFTAAVVIAHAGIDNTTTVEELRAAWWWPLIGLAVTVPWLLRLRRVWVPVSQWQFDPELPRL